MSLRDGGGARRRGDQAHRMAPGDEPGHHEPIPDPDVDPLRRDPVADAAASAEHEPSDEAPSGLTPEHAGPASEGSDTAAETGVGADEPEDPDAWRANLGWHSSVRSTAGVRSGSGRQPDGTPLPDPRDGGWDDDGEDDWRRALGPGLVGVMRPRGRRRSTAPTRSGTLRVVLYVVLLGALVLGAASFALGPVIARSVTNWAAENARALQIPFVADIVRGELGTALTEPAGSSATTVVFTVESGDTAITIADRLKAAGLLVDPRAFVFLAIQRNATSSFTSGDHELRANMTPDEIISVLVDQPRDPHITIALREGLRIEQITALLEKLKLHPDDPTKPLTMDVAAFYQLATHPSAELLADYPWLKLPKGASLEGFLGAATYRVLPDITPEAFIRDMLDAFAANVGTARMQVPAARGMSFYQVVTLASIVQLESAQAQELPLIAGVYQNRLNGYRGVAKVLDSDPSVIYANDTVQLRKLPLDQWPEYSFWNLPTVPMAQVQVPADLLGYQTYTQDGLMPGPICTPTVAAIDAALHPNTSTGYLYFVAKPDGSGTHAFARTNAEFQALLKQYGYIK